MHPLLSGGLGAGTQGPESRGGMGTSPPENFVGVTTRAKPSWGFLLATVLSLAPGGQENREGTCLFWEQLRPNQSIQHLQKEECKSHSTQIIYL